MTPITGFIGGAYTLPSKSIACQRCVNLYVEGVMADDKAPKVLIGTPGFEQLGVSGFGSPWAAGTYQARPGGIYVTSTGLLILAIGELLYAYTGFSDGDLVPYNDDGTPFAQLYYTHELGSGPVAMSDNGLILFLSSGNSVYYYPLDDLNSGTRIGSFPYGGFTSINYLNGRFIINTPYNVTAGETNFFRVSPLEWEGDWSEWDDLAVAAADQSPDPLLGFTVRGSDVFLFSSQSLEAYYDSGASPMPLVPNTSVTFSIGCGAKYSIAEIEDTVFWLGAGANGFNKIYKMGGLTPEVISTPALEQEIATYGTTDDAIAFAYQMGGHVFYIITFQTGNKTWQYDLTTGFWNELTSLNSDGEQERSRYVGIAAFLGRTIALDRVDNAPVLVSSDIYTESGTHIVRLRSSPHVYSELKRVFFHRFQLDMETGVGLTSGQGSDPLMRLRWSNDGGFTWSSFLLRSMGRIGAYLTRVAWNCLGQSRNRVWEISTSEPVPVRILGAWVEAEEGDN